MTQKEKDHIQDLERRIVLLEKELISQLLKGSNPLYSQPYNPGFYTCISCHQQIMSGSIHNCQGGSSNPFVNINQAGAGTSSGATSALNAKACLLCSTWHMIGTVCPNTGKVVTP